VLVDKGEISDVGAWVCPPEVNETGLEAETGPDVSEAEDELETPEVERLPEMPEAEA
jgi:hypothetical protein